MIVEQVVITAREIIREVEIRVSRTVDKPTPVGAAEIDVTPRARLVKRRASRLALVAPRRAA